MRQSLKDGLRRAANAAAHFKVFPPKGLDFGLDIKRFAAGAPLNVIFDVGANLGQSSRTFAQLFPEARIFAFEPIRSTYMQMEANTTGLPRMRRFNFGLGDIPSQEHEVFLQERSGWNSLLEGVNAPRSAGDTPERVKTTTVDEVCRTEEVSHIDLLKTDTEGFDLKVLQGAKRMIDEGNILFVASETGFLEGDRRHTYFFELKDYLEKRNFCFYWLYNPVHRESQIAFCNVLFVHRNAAQVLRERKLRSNGNGSSCSG